MTVKGRQHKKINVGKNIKSQSSGGNI